MGVTTRICRGAASASVALLILAAGTGCGKGDAGMGDYDRMKQAEADASTGLTGQGVRLTEKDYPPYGKAWTVDMSKMTVTDEQLRDLKKVGKIAELNFSGSTISDAQLGLVQELALGLTAIKVDLSNTAVTDAGLDKLDNLMLLMDLNLTGTKVTPAGVKAFRAKRQASERVSPGFKNPKIRS